MTNTKILKEEFGMRLKGTCVKTSYELFEELAEKWETQLLKD